MARFTLFVVSVVGLVCLLEATPLLSGAKEIANAPQIPNFPGPGEIPKPPGMLHSRITREIPHEIPGQDQFPPPPPPPEVPSTRIRRDARPPTGMGNLQSAFGTIFSSSHITASRVKRSAKGSGGKLPRKSG